jgi:hypothetical protein
MTTFNVHGKPMKLFYKPVAVVHVLFIQAIKAIILNSMEVLDLETH